MYFLFFFFKQKTAYEMRISDWSSDVCSSDLAHALVRLQRRQPVALQGAAGDKNVLTAVVRDHEPEALLGVEELHRALDHLGGSLAAALATALAAALPAAVGVPGRSRPPATAPHPVALRPLPTLTPLPSFPHVCGA